MLSVSFAAFVPLAVLAISMLTLAIVAMAVFTLHAAITILFS